jgi:glycerol kinase
VTIGWVKLDGITRCRGALTAPLPKPTLTKRGREWRPAMAATDRETHYALWRKAVIRTLDWV